MKASRPLVIALPGIAGAVLAKLACPVCWGAWSSLFGAVGLGTVQYASLGIPLGLAFLGLSLLSLAYRARQRRGYGPLVAGAVFATVLLFGELQLHSELFTLAGVAGVIGAAIWNAWPNHGLTALNVRGETERRAP